jgi:hypothetical protein
VSGNQSCGAFLSLLPIASEKKKMFLLSQSKRLHVAASCVCKTSHGPSEKYFSRKLPLFSPYEALYFIFLQLDDYF